MWTLPTHYSMPTIVLPCTQIPASPSIQQTPTRFPRICRSTWPSFTPLRGACSPRLNGLCTQEDFTDLFFFSVLPAIVSNPSVKTITLPKHLRRTRSKRATIPSTCGQTITPQCLQAIYNIPTTPATAPGNSIGVSGFANEVANQTDLQVRLRFVSSPWWSLN